VTTISVSPPLYHLRLHAVVTGNPGLTPTFNRTHIKTIIDTVNVLYAQAGIEFVFDPLKDVTEETNAALDAEDPQARVEFAMNYPGKVVVYFRNRNGGVSAHTSTFADMPKGLKAGAILRHELGHYFYLRHTFGGIELTPRKTDDNGNPIITEADKEKDLLAQLVKHVKSYVDELGHPSADGLNVFDGDRYPLDGTEGIKDTPPDDGGQLIAIRSGLRPDNTYPCCGSVDRVAFSVEFKNGHVENYVLQPDRHNVMSYFCCEPLHFSQDQITAVHNSLQKENRKHLLNSWELMGKSIFDRVTTASWGPNHLHLFATNQDGTVLHKAWSETRWWPNQMGWYGIGGPVVGTPTAVSWGSNRLDVFATQQDGTVLHKAFDGSQWWPDQEGWYRLDGQMVDVSTAIAWGADHLDVFARDSKGEVWHKEWDGARWLPSPIG
jgi:hypothetical protein